MNTDTLRGNGSALRHGLSPGTQTRSGTRTRRGDTDTLDGYGHVRDTDKLRGHAQGTQTRSRNTEAMADTDIFGYTNTVKAKRHAMSHGHALGIRTRMLDTDTLCGHAHVQGSRKRSGDTDSSGDTNTLGDKDKLVDTDTLGR